MKLKEQKRLGMLYFVLGAVLAIAGYFIKSSWLASFGGGVCVLGLVRLLRAARLSRDPDQAADYDASLQDERTAYLHPFLRGKMYRYLEANVGVIALPKDEMQRVKQVQRLHKEENLSPDEVAQTLGVSAEKAAELIGYETKALSVSALSGDDSDDDPLAWLLLDQHTLTPEQAVYRQVCTEELEQLFRTLSAKDRAILGHTYGVFGYEKLSADELGLREMLSPDGVTKARKAALERLRSRYPGSGLHLWRDVYHALKDI